MAKKKIKIDKTKYDNTFTDSEFYIVDIECKNDRLTTKLKGYHDTDAYTNDDEALFSDMEVLDIFTTGVSTELDAVITAYEALEDKIIDYLIANDYTGGVKE